MHRVDEQIGERIRDGSAAQVGERREPCSSRRLRVSPEFIRFLDRNTAAIKFDLVRQSVREQVGRQPQIANDLQLCQLVADAVDTGTTGVASQHRDDGESRIAFVTIFWLQESVKLCLHERRKLGDGLGVKMFFVCVDG
jgi:hypothetical protein